jgi:predicted nuclease of predicted toxin-antitoxin system
MKLLLDMNLSPDWVATLTQAGWEAVHWSSIGDFRANEAGALIVLDEVRARVRILPLKS